jgi:molybdopterin-guanine dinucleotide biosynthesis protein
MLDPHFIIAEGFKLIKPKNKIKMKTQTKKQIKAYKKSILNEVIRCERDLYQLSQGNLKVLQTVPLMMQDDFWRGQLRKLVIEYLNGRCIYK